MTGKFIERKDYNKVISIKLVIPSNCNARCCFCYMKDYKIEPTKELFLENFISSLEYLFKEIDGKNSISIDITGNEPTFDLELLQEVMTKLKVFKRTHVVERITITTNGFQLNNDKVYTMFDGVVDYVNISIHDFNQQRRDDIMEFKTPTTEEYVKYVKKLNSIGIDVSAVAVIYRLLKPVDRFELWVSVFTGWCKHCGFKALRFRCDVFWKRNRYFDRYMDVMLNDTKYDIINHEDTTDSHWCRLRRKSDGFRVFFLKGVLDTSILTKGIEYVIANDGKAYCDFYMKTKVEDYEYEIGKIYDYIEETK